MITLKSLNITYNVSSDFEHFRDSFYSKWSARPKLNFITNAVKNTFSCMVQYSRYRTSILKATRGDVLKEKYSGTSAGHGFNHEETVPTKVGRKTKSYRNRTADGKSGKKTTGPIRTRLRSRRAERNEESWKNQQNETQKRVD